MSTRGPVLPDYVAYDARFRCSKVALDQPALSLEHFLFAFALEDAGVVDGVGGSVGCAFTSAAKLSLGAPGP
jgi:hypothetical protein